MCCYARVVRETEIANVPLSCRPRIESGAAMTGGGKWYFCNFRLPKALENSETPVKPVARDTLLGKVAKVLRGT